MTHRLAFCLALVALTVLLPRPTSATDISTMRFDTVDAVELNTDNGGVVNLVITGILAGQSSPVTATFPFSNNSPALQCERFAIIAMSKPGKYQLAVGTFGTAGACRLTLRAP